MLIIKKRGKVTKKFAYMQNFIKNNRFYLCK